MGKGGKKPQQEVTEYYMSEHFGICSAVDAVLGITIKEKTAWEGEKTAEGSISIYNSELFGGVKKEGGVNGIAYFLPGGPAQVLPNGLAARFGLTSATCPGFRGIASLFFVGSHPDGGLWDGEVSTSIDVWKDNTYSGDHSQFTTAIPDLEAYGRGDEISSVKTVGPWVVYEHDNYTGESMVVEGNLPDPFPNGHPLHDKISSLAPLGYAPGATGSSGGFYWSANTPYLPGVWVKVRRAPVGLTASLALIPRTIGDLIADVLADFTGLSWTLPCSGSFPTTCICPAGDTSSAVLGGDPTVTYTMTFRIRGCVELVEYSGGEQLDEHVFKDATGQAIAVANTYTLEVSDPPATYYLNNGETLMDRLDVVDYALTIPVNGGATLTLEAVSHDNGQIKNVTNVSVSDDDVTKPIVVAQPYNGQFMQLDATNIGTEFDANPAHIIYECLTNTDWGMGSPLAAIEYDSFDAASLTLYNEGFGLSLLWTRQSSIQDFVQEILDHIQAVLYVDPSTGLLTLTLIRGDYDEEALPVVDPDNADLTSFNRKLWGDIVNEITVTWTNPENEQDETITAQDDSSIATQGGAVSDSRNYYGVRSASLAQTLAYRDLRSAGQPLATCEAEVDRSQWRLRPASVIKLTWPEYGLTELVMRVTSIDYGKPGDMTVKLTLIEDVYGLDVGSYDTPPSTIWEDPSAPPAPMETVEIFTLPLFFAADTTVAAFVDTPEYPEVLAGVLATTENDDTFSYQLWDEVALPDGSLQWQSLGTNNVIGRGVLLADLDAEALSSGVSFDDVIGQTFPTVGGFVIIGEDGETGNEIAMVTASVGTYSLTRGVLDTVPRAWPAGMPAWFVDGSTLFEDSLVRSAGEVVDYRLRTQTSQGLLPLIDAPIESATLSDRPWLPNRPANVEAFGEAWSSETALIDARARPDPWVTVTWANRNRLTEDSQVLAWTDSTVTPEVGQTTTIEVRDIDGVLLATHDALAGTTFDVPDASFGAELFAELRVYSERSDGDGDFVSLQHFSHWLWVSGDVRFTEASEARFTEDGERRILED